MAAPEGKDPDPPRLGLCGGYLLLIIGEPHTAPHKNVILSRIKSGLLSWEGKDCGVNLEEELSAVIEQALTGEVSKTGERLIQHASDLLVTEILIHPQLSTVGQCVRNLLASHTQHKHVVYAGYTFTGNGSWILQDGIFTLSNLISIFHEPEVRAVLSVPHEPQITLHIHAVSEGDGDWSGPKLEREYFSRLCGVSVNPPPVTLSPGPGIESFIGYLSDLVAVQTVEDILPPTQIVGNIRFTHPTLYVFPGGHGDAALFGINGFNMLIDGGFGRKACFWDFIRHLDRVDAMLMTRINKTNVTSLANVVRRKKASNIHPQVGHFFCNLQDKKHVPTPDVDKDSLLIDVLLEGQEMISNLKAINLKPQPCYRDANMEPINLYHKVGYGKLDMYVISPARDSREVKEFLMKWHSNDTKLFSAFNKKTTFPIQNLVSICALLVWQPANPNETITRLLFPGSAPQYKIFEGLEKIKHLEFLKYPVCTAKSLNTTVVTNRSSSKTRSLKSDAKAGDDLVTKTNKLIEDLTKENLLKPEITKDICNEEELKKEEKEKPRKTAPKKIVKARVDTKITKTKPTAVDKDPIKDTKEKDKESTKSSPTSPKKSIDAKMNGIIKASRIRNKSSPSSTPSRSAKEEVKKATETRKSTAPRSAAARTKSTSRVKEDGKTTSVPKKVARRPGDAKKEDKKANMKLENIKNESGLTTDSSTVSTPSTADNAAELKEHIVSKVTKEMYKITTSVPEKGQDTEEDEIMTIEKLEQEAEIAEQTAETEHQEGQAKENGEQKEEKKEDEEKNVEEEISKEVEKLGEENEVEDNVEAKEDIEGKTALNLELNLSQEDQEKEQTDDKKEDLKEDVTADSKVVKEATVKKTPGSELSSEDIGKVQKDSDDKKDEKIVSTVESGQTTTAPTLPEDERIPLDEVKAEKINIAGKKIDLKKEGHISKIQSGIVKTPDEVADLPVHEEVDATDYEEIEKKDEGIDEDIEEEEVLEEQDGSTDIMSTDIIKGSVSFITTTRESDDVLNQTEDGDKLEEKTEDEKITDEKHLEESRSVLDKEDANKSKLEESAAETKEISEEDKSIKDKLDKSELNLSNKDLVASLTKDKTAESKEIDEGKAGVDEVEIENEESKEVAIVEEPVYKNLKPDHAEFVTVTPDSSVQVSPKKTEGVDILQTENDTMKTSDMSAEKEEHSAPEALEEVLEKECAESKEKSSGIKEKNEQENQKLTETKDKTLKLEEKIENQEHKSTEFEEVEKDSKETIEKSKDTTHLEKETTPLEDKEPVREKVDSPTPLEITTSLAENTEIKENDKNLDKEIDKQNYSVEKITEKSDETLDDNLKISEIQSDESTAPLVNDTNELHVTQGSTGSSVSPRDSSVPSPTKFDLKESKENDALKSLLAVNDSVTEKTVSISENEIESSVILSEKTSSKETLPREKKSEKEVASSIGLVEKSPTDTKEKINEDEISEKKDESKIETEEPQTEKDSLDPTKYKSDVDNTQEEISMKTCTKIESSTIEIKKDTSDKIVEEEQGSPPKSPFDKIDSRKTSTESLGNKSTTESILSAEQPEESEKDALTSQERKISKDESIVGDVVKSEPIKPGEESELGVEETLKQLQTTETIDKSNTSKLLNSVEAQLATSKNDDVQTITEQKSSADPTSIDAGNIDSESKERELSSKSLDDIKTDTILDSSKDDTTTPKKSLSEHLDTEKALFEQFSSTIGLKEDDVLTEQLEKTLQFQVASDVEKITESGEEILSKEKLLTHSEPTKENSEIDEKSLDPTKLAEISSDKVKLPSPTKSPVSEPYNKSSIALEGLTKTLKEESSSVSKSLEEKVKTPPKSPIEKSSGPAEPTEKEPVDKSTDIEKKSSPEKKLSNQTSETEQLATISTSEIENPAEESPEIKEDGTLSNAPIEKSPIIEKDSSSKISTLTESKDIEKETKTPPKSEIEQLTERPKEIDISPSMSSIEKSPHIDKVLSQKISLLDDSKELTTPQKSNTEKLAEQFKENEKPLSPPKSPMEKTSVIDKLPSPNKLTAEDAVDAEKQVATSTPEKEQLVDKSKETNASSSPPKSPIEKSSEFEKLSPLKKTSPEDSKETQKSDESKETEKSASPPKSPAIDKLPSPKESLAGETEKEKSVPEDSNETQKLADKSKLIEKSETPPTSPGGKSSGSPNKSLLEESKESEQQKSVLEDKETKKAESPSKSPTGKSSGTDKLPSPNKVLPEELEQIEKLATPPKSPNVKSSELPSPPKSPSGKSIEIVEKYESSEKSLPADNKSEEKKKPTTPTKSPVQHVSESSKISSPSKSPEKESKETGKIESLEKVLIETKLETENILSPKKSPAQELSTVDQVTGLPKSPAEVSNVEEIATPLRSPTEKVPSTATSLEIDSNVTDKTLKTDLSVENLSPSKQTMQSSKEKDKIEKTSAEVQIKEISLVEKDVKTGTPPKSPTAKSNESLPTPPKTPIQISSDSKLSLDSKSPMKTSDESENCSTSLKLTEKGEHTLSSRKSSETFEDAKLSCTLISPMKKSPGTDKLASPPKSPVDKKVSPSLEESNVISISKNVSSNLTSGIDMAENGESHIKVDSTPKLFTDSNISEKNETLSPIVQNAPKEKEIVNQDSNDEMPFESDSEKNNTGKEEVSANNMSNVFSSISSGISSSVAEIIQTVEDMSTEIIKISEHATDAKLDISKAKEDNSTPIIEKTDGEITSKVMSLSSETSNMKTDLKTEVEIKAVDISSTNESQSTSVNVELDQHKSDVEVAKGNLQVDNRRDSKSSPTISISGSPEKRDHNIVLKELSVEKTLSSTSSVKDEDSKKTTPAISPSISINGSPVKDIDKLTKEFSVEKLDETKPFSNGDVLLNGIKNETDENKEPLSSLKSAVAEGSPSSSRKSSNADVKELGLHSNVTNESNKTSSSHTVTVTATIESSPCQLEQTIETKVFETIPSGANGALTKQTTSHVTDHSSSDKTVTVVKSDIDSKNGNLEIVTKEVVSVVKEKEERTETPDAEMIRSRMMPMRTSYIGAGDSSRSETPDSRLDDLEDDAPMSPVSVTSSFSPPPELMLGVQVDNTVLDNMTTSVIDPMSASVMMSSFYGTLPGSDDNENIAFQRALDEHRSVRGNDPLTDNVMSTSMTTSMTTSINTMPRDTNGNANIRHNLNEQESAFIGQSLTTTQSTVPNDPIKDWGKPLGLPPPPSPQNKRILVWNPVEEWGRPLGLPSPVPLADSMDETCPDNINVELTPINDKLTPRKTGKKDISGKPKRPDSPGKYKVKDLAKRPPTGAVYVDLAYIPHHGHTSYTNSEFFKKIRARHYVFSGIEPSKQVFNALLEAKQTWEDKDLETTIIPTYDTETLGCWVTENEETLTKYKIDLSPSASRCTINLQDHETSCSAYRLEF